MPKEERKFYLWKISECVILHLFMIPVYLNFSNCTINTIQVHKNGCKWHPYFIAICFHHVWPSLGSLHLLSSLCEIKGSHLLTQFWLLSAFQNLFCLLTVTFLLLCIVITQMSRHLSLSTLSWFQTDRRHQVKPHLGRELSWCSHI